MYTVNAFLKKIEEENHCARFSCLGSKMVALPITGALWWHDEAALAVGHKGRVEIRFVMDNTRVSRLATIDPVIYMLRTDYDEHFVVGADSGVYYLENSAEHNMFKGFCPTLPLATVMREAKRLGGFGKYFEKEYVPSPSFVVVDEPQAKRLGAYAQMLEIVEREQ